MPIFQQGSINTTALLVPDLYVQIMQPSVALLNGVPTNALGIVGTASWGPVGAPTPLSSMADYARMFGPILTNKFDGGTAVAAAVLQGANNIFFVRASDGTEVAATCAVKDASAATAITLTSLYPGTYGNNMQANVVAGSQASTYKLIIAMPGYVPEIFDNIPGTGTTLWANMIAAVNQGQSGLRGPSQFVVASGAGTAALPNTSSTFSFTSGTDGISGVTATTLVGVDTIPRKGMYALRNTGCSIAMLADADDSTQWSTQVAFGLSEGMYMILVGPAGQTVTTAITAKTTAAIDSYAFKLMLGDWVYFNDTVNGKLRLISPQGFVAGRLANLSPEQSSLNKPIQGIVGTQTSYANKLYSNAELSLLVAAGIDVITAPSPGGNYYSCRVGHNGSSNPVINGDNYTRMTNYISATLDAGMGQFIGRLQTRLERLEAKAAIETFLAAMEDQGMIGDVNGGAAFSVVLDATNNPSNRVALGYQQCDVKIKYLSIVEKFIVNVEGGTSVQINRVGATPS